MLRNLVKIKAYNPMKYDYQINLDQDSTASRLLKMVGRDKLVLEVGTSTGYMSRVMKEEFGCTVHGIEIDPESAKIAQPFLETLIIGDVEKIDFEKQYGSIRFDVITFADVLEHTVYPKKVLEKAKEYLTQDGKILISVPNITYLGVILLLIHGKFNYTSTGILDNTHLHFFSRSSLFGLVKDAGFKLSEIHEMKKPLFDSEFSITMEAIPKHIIEYILNINSDSLIYQYVVSIEKGEFLLPEQGSVDLDVNIFINRESVLAEELKQKYLLLNKSAQEVSQWALALDKENKELKKKVQDKSVFSKILRFLKK